ncbi:D-alanyl-D-alanine carboxypeptidase/D-alanyl-D-alanine-endopeptidase (penicillin-binding protein 4) [Pelomonas saccharophila]|uniref:D-alanyl-D-alanine carboxypeptidase/D-alanyl-D-alanine-endopeptidase (Penicillin-binding protein 4) n=1 Tax=Roseateles saccharophilus TaxID=304 RepID=A0ABU1YLZ4_ROSSA|nr:D-alanyl-D-alanine carboxypeptidase/D-alanyl-D-alanine-endopeptidase [Roseateles saccharophilus]MDR7269879.1 D-alanyl-D-alanine carboxypeptidase/D-alanyl-D-alanine-endopeptidase (penicillin-binding protein 4) [Roseateles saccharophilus]
MGGQAAEPLPLSVQVALRQAQLPATALGVVVQALDEARPRLAWQADLPQNPASLTKLITSMAALDTLGPAWQWQTPVWLTEDGGLAIQGSGDPRLSTERLWAGLKHLGVAELRGPLRLDRSAFTPGTAEPGDFDREPWRVGNAQPEALLLNAKAVSYTFRVDGQTVRVTADPPLDPPVLVPMAAGACGDWRSALKLQWAPGQRPRFTGSYPAACGEQTWTLADPEPATYPARLLALMLREAGIAWRGEAIVEATAPAAAPTLLWPGPTLAEALRDMNKASSNLMAQQVLLSTARAAGVPAPSPDTAAIWLQAWLDAHVGTTPPSRVVNGSGLARETRISPTQLATLLHWAWVQPWMPELLASLPVAGLDGTLSRQPGRFGAAAGRAHLKTGSLRDVVALAGIVDAPSGKRWVLVAMVNHPQAQAGRGVLEALLRWVAQDAPPATSAR